MATRSLRCAVVALIAASPSRCRPSAIGRRAQRRPSGSSRRRRRLRSRSRREPIAAFDHRDPDRRRFGMLDFRGGLVLTSPFREFGGISAISVAPDGANFIAVTDRSWWLRGRITYAGTRPTGIAAAEMAPMLGPDGRTLRARRWYDTEAIARDGDTLYVGIERVHRIVRFDFGKDGLKARGRVGRGAGRVPLVARATAASRRWPSCRAAQSARRHADRDFRTRPRPRRQSSRFPDRRPAPGPVHDQAQERLRRQRRHPAAARRSPDPGTQVRLDHRPVHPHPAHSDRDRSRPARWSTGRSCSRPISASRSTIWKGISVHRAGGETVLTLISDDNFSLLQRTLLLQFTLVEP